MSVYTRKTLKYMGVKTDVSDRIKNKASSADKGLKEMFDILTEALEIGREEGANLKDAPETDQKAYDDATLAMSHLKEFHTWWRGVYGGKPFEAKSLQSRSTVSGKAQLFGMPKGVTAEQVSDWSMEAYEIHGRFENIMNEAGSLHSRMKGKLGNATFSTAKTILADFGDLLKALSEGQDAFLKVVFETSKLSRQLGMAERE